MFRDQIFTLRVRNWEKYQVPPRQSGWTPPWCKLLHKSLDDYHYTALSREEKWLLMELYKLATKWDNEIPSDAKWISQSVRDDDVEGVKELLLGLLKAGFLEVDEVEIETLEPDPPKVRVEGPLDASNGLVDPMSTSWRQVVDIEERRGEETLRGEVREGRSLWRRLRTS